MIPCLFDSGSQSQYHSVVKLIFRCSLCNFTSIICVCLCVFVVAVVAVVAAVVVVVVLIVGLFVT